MRNRFSLILHARIILSIFHIACLCCFSIFFFLKKKRKENGGEDADFFFFNSFSDIACIFT
jgi:hypothetical protein